MSRDELGEQVLAPTMELAAKVAAALEGNDKTLVDVEWGTFYVSRVELKCTSSGVSEVVGYLVPDEGDGGTFDFWTPAAPERGETKGAGE